MKFTNTVLAIALLSFVSCSQEKVQELVETGLDQSKMDSLFTVIVENEKAMGSISIFKDGQEVYQNAFGYADVTNNMAATAKTTYRIGSISKTFTASIVMQLVDENKLTLDTKVEEFYPMIPNASTITIEQLLRHRSGLFNMTNAPEYLQWMEQPKTRDELIAIFVQNGTVFEPNEKTEYSNTNFVLLSFIAEKIDGQSFADILKDRIATPLNLSSTYYGAKINTSQNEALSYKKTGSWVKDTETDMSIPVGAGAIVSNPTDLNAFYNALFAGKIVSEKSLNLMKTMVDNIGMGLFQIPFYDKTAFGHNGGIDGFRSNAAYFPIEGVSIAFTSNGMAMNMNDILLGALSIYFEKEYELPEFTPGIELNAADLDIYLGVYSSPDFPLKITITKNDNILIAQATGQPPLSLEAFEEHKFRFDQAGIVMEFLPEESKVILKQGGGEFVLTKE